MRQNLSLRPYQKQSLAFALNIELRPRDCDLSLLPPVGTYPCPANGNRSTECFSGWICDEMGMGKTAVVIALCVANPAASSQRRASDADWQTFVKCGRHKPRPREWIKIKAPVGMVQRRHFNADRKKKLAGNRWHQNRGGKTSWRVVRLRLLSVALLMKSAPHKQEML